MTRPFEEEDAETWYGAALLHFEHYRMMHLAGANINMGYRGKNLKEHLLELRRDEMTHIWIDSGKDEYRVLVLGRSFGEDEFGIHVCYFKRNNPEKELPKYDQFYVMRYSDLDEIPDESMSWKEDSARLVSYQVTMEGYWRQVTEKGYLRGRKKTVEHVR